MKQRTVYLADHAKDQLETSDDASVWARRISFKDQPEPSFTYELLLREEELEYCPLEDGYLHPDRTEPDSILEMLIKVTPPKPKRKKVTLKPGDEVTVYLHGAGVKSETTEIVKKVGRKYLSIESDEERMDKFDMATGKCVNDIEPEFSFGFYRTIDKLL